MGNLTLFLFQIRGKMQQRNCGLSVENDFLKYAPEGLSGAVFVVDLENVTNV